MSIDQLIKVLDGAGLEFNAEDILDAIWLAGLDRVLALQSFGPAIATPGPGPTQPRPPPVEPPPGQVADDAGGKKTNDPVAAPPERQAAPVYAHGSPSGADRTVKASPVSVPAGRALFNRLALMRSLRPLRQRWPSSQDSDLDEEQTVAATAELRGARFQSIYPVFQPRRERWFDVELVCEDDPAIELWDEALRDFAQMLRDTGAFRQVRSWRLRLAAGAAAPSSSAILETPAGGRIPTRGLAGRGTRRLIFFASHGSSRHWGNGQYARVLEPWINDCSVVLLHLMPRERWQHTPLGDPHGVCAAEQPGASGALLKLEPFWWMISFDPANTTLLPLPVTPLMPAAMSEWAHMQMARGRHSPVFLIDPRAPALSEVPSDPASTRDAERTVAHLRATSPEAFQLAVYLCSRPFTIPVARLIQHATSGAAADQSHLAELFLSGLIVAKASSGDSLDNNARYFDVWPQARAVLLRSLRESDAQRLGEELQRRVSQYIEQISGSPFSFAGLVPDENGKYALPNWAQPFAEVAGALLGLAPDGESSLDLFRRFQTAYPPEIVGAGARLAADGKPPRRDSVGAEVWDALVHSRIVRQTADGEWTFVPGVADKLERLGKDMPLLGAGILWLDDDHSDDVLVERLMRAGASVRLATTLKQAMSGLSSNRYRILIADAAFSDMALGYEIVGIRSLARTQPHPSRTCNDHLCGSV